jgi:uncharacterized membrane protein (UPF0127 family)
VKISNASSPSPLVTVKYCDTFLSKLKGLMFSRDLDRDAGLIFVENKETRINTSIHMLFMNFDLTILWLDKHRVVVDKVLAKRWVPFYFSKHLAQYVVELHHSTFNHYSIGDNLVFRNEG